VRALTRPEIKEKLLSLGSQVVANSPEQLAAAMKSDMTRIGKVIADANIKGEH
jgi:hypothetical protein